MVANTDPSAARFTYTIPLPAGLGKNPVNTPQSIIGSSSRSAMIPGVCQRAVDELLLALITTLNQDFLADLRPCISPREPVQGQCQEENVRILVCIGSSNLHRTIPHFTSLGYEVIDLAQKGWIVSPGNVGTLLDKVRAMDLLSGHTVVLKLFGNITFRWVHEDGTLVLPVKTVIICLAILRVVMTKCSGVWLKMFYQFFTTLKRIKRLWCHPSPGMCSGQRCGSESERIRAFFAESESEIFVPDSDPDSDPVPDPVI
jgi:hypothetical protein